MSSFSRLYIMDNLRSALFFPLRRNGVVHEGGGLAGRGAYRGGEEPAVGRLQERDRRPQGLLEDRLLHRAEGGEQGGRGQAEAHQDLQREGTCAARAPVETETQSRLPRSEKGMAGKRDMHLYARSDYL